MRSRADQGFTGLLNGGLKGCLYAAIYGDGSAAFGRLTTNDFKEPCPTASWLASDQFAVGFRRRGGDEARIFMRTNQGPGRPLSMSALEVDWFMPVERGDVEERVWSDFHSRLPGPLRDRLDVVTRGQAFGGLQSQLLLTSDGQDSPLGVDGMMVHTLRHAYLLMPGRSVSGRNGQPAALVRSYSESPAACRVIFYGRQTTSFDATFSHL